MLTYERTADYVLTLSDIGKQRLADEQRMQRLDPIYDRSAIIGASGAVLAIAGLVIRQLTGG